MVKVDSILDEFFGTLDTILGFYLDGNMAFSLAVKYLKEHQHAAIATFQANGEAWTLERLDEQKMIIGKGDPNTPDARPLHITTQGEFKARNRKAGRNPRLIGNLCTVLIYQYWEDHFRALLATALGVASNTIQIDVMGDLRLIRNSIIHNGQVATHETARCKVIKWFQPGDPIQFTQDQFEELVRITAQSVIAFLEGHRPAPPTNRSGT